MSSFGMVLPFDGQISPLRCASVEMTERDIP